MQNSHLQSGDALALGGANGVENKLKRKQPEDATSPRKTYGSLGGDIPVKKQKLEQPWKMPRQAYSREKVDSFLCHVCNQIN